MGAVTMSRVSETPGAALDWPALKFRNPAEAGAAFELWSWLRCACGVGEPAGGRFVVSDRDPTSWRTLRECDVDTLGIALGRVEAVHGWRLPGDPSEPLLDRLDKFYATAAARKQLAVA
jgi:hypothetical protein